MTSKSVRYRIPSTSFWNASLVSETFVTWELQRARSVLADTDKDFERTAQEIEAIGQEIKSKWATANVQVMRAFEARLKEIRLERSRIGWAQRRIGIEIQYMLKIGRDRGWHLK